MNEPVTELDQRFSDQGAIATGWEETRGVLAAAVLFWITTVRADGRPHLTPLVAVWHEDALYFCTGATEQKAVNLRGNPHVILMTGCHDWESGQVLLAHYVKPPHVPEHLDVYVESMLSPRLGDDHYPGTSRPDRVLGYAAAGGRFREVVIDD